MIIDDEEIVARGIEKYALQGSLAHRPLFIFAVLLLEALQVMTNNNIDLIFLDIEMPKFTGLQFLKSLPDPPLVVIITAYPEYALEGYELEVIDYILKPFSFERFLKACNKCKEYFDLKNHHDVINETYFFIKANNRIKKLMCLISFFIEALENYINIYTTKKYLTLVGLNIVAFILPERQQFYKSSEIIYNCEIKN